MIQIYRGPDGKIKVVRVTHRDDMPKAPPASPGSGGMPWSQVSLSDKEAMRAAERARRADLVARGLPVPNDPIS